MAVLTKTSGNRKQIETASRRIIHTFYFLYLRAFFVLEKVFSVIYRKKKAHFYLFRWLDIIVEANSKKNFICLSFKTYYFFLEHIFSFRFFYDIFSVLCNVVSENVGKGLFIEGRLEDFFLRCNRHLWFKTVQFKYWWQSLQWNGICCSVTQGNFRFGFWISIIFFGVRKSVGVENRF